MQDPKFGFDKDLGLDLINESRKKLGGNIIKFLKVL
jgi:hypothetical protein